jgi:hypothetical protein
MSDLVTTLKSVQTLASSAAGLLPAPAGTVAGVIVEAIGLAIASVNAGHDPVSRLRRMRRREELLSSANQRILDALKEKAGGDKSNP